MITNCFYHFLKRFFLILILIVIASGCATTKITSLRGSHDTVIAKLNDVATEKSEYYLMSSSCGNLAQSYIKNGSLIFNLPINESDIYRDDECLYIIDKDKKEISYENSSDNGFRNSLWSDYLLYSQEISRLINSIDSDKKQLRASLINFETAKGWLNTNSHIYQNGQCVKPYLGDPPATACSPYEKDTKGIAMCAAAIGGCNLVSNKLGDKLGSSAARYLSSQACSALAAELMEDSYKLEDMLGNFALDLADSFADSMMKGDSFLGKIIGLATKVGVITKQLQEFEKCVNHARYVCSKKYTEWEQTPLALQRECNDYLNQISTKEIERVDSLQSRIDDLSNKLEMVSDRKKQIAVSKETLIYTKTTLIFYGIFFDHMLYFHPDFKIFGGYHETI